MTSPKTTIAGAIAIVLVLCATALYIWGPVESHTTANQIIMGLLGLATSVVSAGLMLARDNDKSSEDVGIK